jgi:regulatory protein YycI of two-component signal transduction system YycFG
MSKKDSILIFAMLLLVILSVSALFYRSIVLQDFELMSIEEEVEEEETGIEVEEDINEEEI